MRLTTTVKKGLAVMAVAAVSFIGVSSIVNATETTGTLTIHKYTKTNDNGTHAGTGVTTDDSHKGSGQPVEGVKFTVKKVTQTGDLTNNAQLKVANEIENAFKTQKDIEKLTYGTSAEKVTFDSSSQTMTTTVAGEATFSSLSRGLYYVYESEVKNAQVNKKQVQVTPSEPFFVAIPFGDSMDVHVYPKNQISEDTTKVPDFSDLKNNKVSYTVTAFLPKKPAAGFKKFDLLDKPGNAFNVNSFKLKSLKAVAKDTPNAPKKEWTMPRDGLAINSVESQALTITSQTGVVNCSFSEMGLGELGTAADNGANQVIYTYTLDLNPAFTTTGGVVENRALVVPSPESGTDIDDKIGGGGTPPGVVVNTKKLVSLKIVKQDGADNSKKLAGAQFNIYSCSAAGKFSDSEGMTYKDSTDRPVKRAQAQQWNKDPLTSASSSGETSSVLITENTKVCVQEIKAPTDTNASGAPYVLLPEDTVVNTNAVTSDNRNTTQVVNIDNYARNFNFALPMTGANTAIVLSLSGLALIIAAAVLRMRRAKN